MKIYRVALLEDNPDDRQDLLELVERIPFLTVSGVFDNAITALPVLSTNPVDILLLDLHMPGLSGFGFLRALPHSPAVILTTASLANSMEAFEVGAVDYLVKPIRYERLMRAVNRVLSRQPEPASLASVTVKQGSDFVQVTHAELTHIEAFGPYSKLHLVNTRTLLVNHLLTDLLEKLPPNQFVRVHRSFVVSLAQVSSYSSRQLVVRNQSIPMGRAYLENFLSRLDTLEK
jgi:DNA-binding LytR/AlgR family response regulator